MYLMTFSCPLSELYEFDIGKSWGFDPHCLLDPVSSNINGLFVAKFVKVLSDSSMKLELLPT